MLKRILKELYLKIDSYMIDTMYYVRKFFGVNKYQESSDKKKKVLIFQVDAFGDNILFLDIAKEFRKIYPKTEYKLYLICQSTYKVLYEGQDYFDEYILMSGQYLSSYKDKLKRAIDRYKLFYCTSGIHFDIIVNPWWGRKAFADSLVRLFSAKEKIGMDGNVMMISTQKQKEKADRWYTKIIHIEDQRKMALQIQAEFMQKLGNYEFKPQMPYLKPTKVDGDFLSEKYFIIFPGASTDRRRWPIERFAEITLRIVQKAGWTPVICGGGGEKWLAEKIKEANKDITFIDMVGKTSILELIEWIRRADFLFTNETSAIHIAGATKTASMAILGHGVYGNYFPYNFDGMNPNEVPEEISKVISCTGCNWVCDKVTPNSETFPCIENISIEYAWGLIEQKLEKILDDNAMKEQ